jgi:hypothetical protein
MSARCADRDVSTPGMSPAGSNGAANFAHVPVGRFSRGGFAGSEDRLRFVNAPSIAPVAAD